MAEQPELAASGVVSFREPVFIPGIGYCAAAFCGRWAFKTGEDPSAAPWQGRGPFVRTWFAVAMSAPVNDAARPGKVCSTVLLLIPGENILGFAACDKAPQDVRDVEPEAVIAL